jgi:hypothetical protein
MTGVFFNVAIGRGIVYIPESEYTQLHVRSRTLTPWQGLRPHAQPTSLVLVHRGNGGDSPAVLIVFDNVDDAAATRLVKQVNRDNGELMWRGWLQLPTHQGTWSRLKQLTYDLTVGCDGSHVVAL